jgi:hypothetical protein
MFGLIYPLKTRLKIIVTDTAVKINADRIGLFKLRAIPRK